MAEVVAGARKLRNIDRRSSTLRALWAGARNPRRRQARRSDDHRLAAVDWHHPQWLAVAMLVLLLCCIDIVLTLVLVSDGGSEVNPVMRPLVNGPVATFIFWKFGLTAIGVVVLIVMARVRLFGRVRAGPVLYLILAGYIALILWEAWLLAHALGITSVSMLLPG
jgi:hypothetical protein